MASGKRKQGESFEDYRTRLREEDKAAKARLKGKWFKKFEPRQESDQGQKLK